MSSATASVARYHGYLWSFVQPQLGQRVLEVGVGFGQYSRRMLAERRRVLGCDLDAGHLDELKNSVSSPLLETLCLDLEEPEPSLAQALGSAGWDTVTTRYINLPDIPGWLAAGWLSRASRSESKLNAPSTNWLLQFYDCFFVGLSRLTDALAAKVAGLSVLAIGTKRQPSHRLRSWECGIGFRIVKGLDGRGFWLASP